MTRAAFKISSICNRVQANKMNSKEITSLFKAQLRQCLSDGIFVEKIVLHQVPVILDCLPEYKFQHRASYKPTKLYILNIFLIYSSYTELGYTGFHFL